ncbi:MAG: hypothetical protein ACLGI9_10930, partial [Thermoanaerobaculia bacterium]
MVFRGKVKDNVVILEPGIRLPDGAAVRIELEPAASREEPDPLLRMADLAIDTGIPDLATNID